MLGSYSVHTCVGWRTSKGRPLWYPGLPEKGCRTSDRCADSTKFTRTKCLWTPTLASTSVSVRAMVICVHTRAHAQDSVAMAEICVHTWARD